MSALYVKDTEAKVRRLHMYGHAQQDRYLIEEWSLILQALETTRVPNPRKQASVKVWRGGEGHYPHVNFNDGYDVSSKTDAPIVFTGPAEEAWQIFGIHVRMI